MLALMVVVLFLTLRFCKGLIRDLTAAHQESLEALKEVPLRQLQLVDKATTIAAASDIAGYQGMQVMDQYASGYDEGSFDPSPEAEARREAERMNLDPEDVGGEDDEALSNLLLG